jgi:hypothetical protein
MRTEAFSRGILLRELAQLRAELVELAFTMDRRGHPEAADVAMMVSARVGELSAEFKGSDWIQSAGAMRSGGS